MTSHWRSWLPFRRWHVAAIVTSADEVPAALPRNGAVLVFDAGLEKWVVFDCPCGRGHRIMLNTDRRRRPAWKVDLRSLDRLTIAPSIDAHTNGRRCHYFVRRGRVIWT